MLLSTRLLVLAIGVIIVGGVVLLNWLSKKDCERVERGFRARTSLLHQSPVVHRGVKKRKRVKVPAGWQVIRGGKR